MTEQILPFPTAILGRYGDQTVAVAIYAAILGSTGLCIWLMWWYGIRRHLFTPSLEPQAARQFRWRAFLTPAVFFLSIPVAFWQPRVAQASWGLIWLGIYILSRPGWRVPHAR